MSSMTAEQVWALVKDWPREAWPKDSSFVDDMTILDGRGNPVDPDYAVHAFVGSGLAWLANRGGAPTLNKGGPYWECVIWLPDGKGDVDAIAPTDSGALGAVSAAVIAAAKEGE